jgi:hypothetical protein
LLAEGMGMETAGLPISVEFMNEIISVIDTLAKEEKIVIKREGPTKNSFASLVKSMKKCHSHKKIKPDLKLRAVRVMNRLFGTYVKFLEAEEAEWEVQREQAIEENKFAPDLFADFLSLMDYHDDDVRTESCEGMIKIVDEMIPENKYLKQKQHEILM